MKHLVASLGLPGIEISAVFAQPELTAQNWPRAGTLARVTCVAIASLAAVAYSAKAQEASPGVRLIVGQPGGPAAPTPTAEPAQPGTQPISARVMTRSGALLQLLDRAAEFIMREDPIAASTRGDLRFNDQLRDESPEAYDRRLSELKEMLAGVKALDRTSLAAGGFGDEDALDADLLQYELELQIATAELKLEQMPVNSMDGPHVWLPQLAEMVPMRTAKHVDDYVTRLEKMPLQIDQIIEQMRRGLAAGRTAPKVVLKHVLASIRSHASPTFLTVEGVKESPFYRPLRTAWASDTAKARGTKAIQEGLVPAFDRLGKFLETTYIPACRESIGYGQSIDGTKAYDVRLRSFTTTQMTASEIHALGLSEVARLRAAMDRVIDATDWPEKSMSPESRFAAFLAYLRTNPRFYYTHAEQMLSDYRDLCKRIDPELPKLFRTLPRNTYGVRAIPKFAAMTSPAAYCYPGSYRSGVPSYFMVNTYDLTQRPKYGMVSLTLHEAAPGHYFQLAIADELESVHTFRTLTGYTAYVEGWALYCEQLGMEMDPQPGMRAISSQPSAEGKGFYKDPYDDFGRLSDEIWRACRLVVDTGMHAFGWDRARALAYMMENTAGTELDLTSEIDRYISWPGQACAYKVGQLTISRLRASATQRLGDSFDIREFHDQVLLGGALPMPVLEKRVERWITQRIAAKK